MPEGPKSEHPKPKPAKKLKENSDEESGGYESDELMIETRKRAIKLKEKKKTAKKVVMKPKFKPIKSKFLETEADEGSASNDENDEQEISKPAKGNNKNLSDLI